MKNKMNEFASIFLVAIIALCFVGCSTVESRLPSGVVTILLEQSDNFSEFDNRYYQIESINSGCSNERKLITFRGDVVVLLYNSKLKKYLIPTTYKVAKLPYYMTKIYKNSTTELPRESGGYGYFRVKNTNVNERLIFIFLPDNGTSAWVYPAINEGVDISQLPSKRVRHEGLVYNLKFPNVTKMNKINIETVNKILRTVLNCSSSVVKI